MTNANEIIEAAKKRLSEIDAEAARLRAMLAAAGEIVPGPAPAVAPCLLPHYPPAAPIVWTSPPTKPLDIYVGDPPDSLRTVTVSGLDVTGGLRATLHNSTLDFSGATVVGLS